MRVLATIVFLTALSLMPVGAQAEPPAAKSDSARNVYRCESAGAVVYADRPCGDAARQVAVDTRTVNIEHSVSVAETPSRAPTEREPEHHRTQRSPPDEKAKRDADCRRIAAALGSIRDHLRRGYNVTQGERLKARERTLREQSSVKRCR